MTWQKVKAIQRNLELHWIGLFVLLILGGCLGDILNYLGHPFIRVNDLDSVFICKRRIIMNVIQKSEAIKTGLQKGVQDGSSKMAKRKCYGYDINPDGELAVNPDEVKVVCWIFEQYLVGDSLGKIAAGLKRQGIPSPTGKPR